MRLENFFVRFVVFGLIGWWPAWRGLVAEQRRLADGGNISQQQYARIVGRMAHEKSLYSEVSVYLRHPVCTCEKGASRSFSVPHGVGSRSSCSYTRDPDDSGTALNPAMNLGVRGIAHSAKRIERIGRNTQHVIRLQSQCTPLVRFR